MLARKPGYYCDGEAVVTETGANPRDVLTIAAEPLSEKHYAAFPVALAAWAIRAGTSAGGYCSACNAPWARVIGGTAEAWLPTCSCPGPPPPRRPRVLDCFCGSGRTGIAAQRLGCDFIGIDLSEAYADMARRLLCDDMPLFAGLEG